MATVSFDRRLRNGLRVMSTQPEHAEQLEQLQITVFPTLADDERFKAEHYLKHIELFPEGQLVTLDGERVVGMTTTVLLDLDRTHPDSFADVIRGGWCTSHEPDGTWMYGLDVGSHPDYRGLGIGRALYSARHAIVRQLALKGQATEGMLSGYHNHQDKMSLEEYYQAVASGQMRDPTVSAQMKFGFEPRGLRRDYLDDPCCANACATLELPADKDVPADWAQ